MKEKIIILTFALGVVVFGILIKQLLCKYENMDYSIINGQCVAKKELEK